MRSVWQVKVISNLGHWLQTQNVEALVQHKCGRFGQQNAVAVNHHDFAVLVLFDAIATVVELGESGAHFVNVFAQMVQTQILCDFMDDVG